MKLAALALIGAVVAQGNEEGLGESNPDSAFLCNDRKIGASCNDKLEDMIAEWEVGAFADNEDTRPKEGTLCM